MCFVFPTSPPSDKCALYRLINFVYIRKVSLYGSVPSERRSELIILEIDIQTAMALLIVDSLKMREMGVVHSVRPQESRNRGTLFEISGG
jgi:hypothetical protein